MKAQFNLYDFVQGISRTYKRIIEIGFLFLIKKVIKVFRQEGVAAGFRFLKRNSIALLRRVMRYGSYERWLHLYGTLTPSDLKKMHATIDAWDNKPLISIILPTFNSNLDFLAAAIDSVTHQIYPKWELCIADDASIDPLVTEFLNHYQLQDKRIKVTFRKENGHISAASNTALQLATGEWIALLDHDDLLEPTALFWVVHAININQEIQIIYSDEDKIDKKGKRFDPYFKPDWNKDLFYSQNYLCHLSIFRKQLLVEIGGFRIGYEGAQDYDLSLRCIEKIKPHEIYHIPRVLYHWRRHEQSTSHSMSAKNYAVDAGQRALNEHFKSAGIKGYVKPVPGGYRAYYDLPDPLPLVSLVIPTRNSYQLVRQCIESIVSKTTYTNYEIILVDNHSDELESLDYFSMLAHDGIVRLIQYPHEFNYSAINNFAVERARGEIIGLINNDIEVIAPDWLSEMVSLVSQEGVGAVGAKLLYPNHSIQHAGIVLGISGVAGHSHKYFAKDDIGYFHRLKLISSYSAVTAACLLVKKNNYIELGGFNENNLSIALNDVDFCLRLKNIGYRNVFTPYALLLHHESATRGEDGLSHNKIRFDSERAYIKKQWLMECLNDPAYSPNLTINHEDFSLGFPPRIT